MLAANFCEEDLSRAKCDDLFCSIFPVVHINRPVQYSEHFLAFVSVPFIRLIGPVQARRYATHLGDVYCGPRPIACELFAANDPHVRMPPNTPNVRNDAHERALAALAKCRCQLRG